MHLLLTIILIIVVFWKGDWRHWQKYILTIYYVVTCNLLYNLLCKDHMLWKHNPDILPKSHTLVDLLYTFIVLPAMVLLFLSHYPFSNSKGKQVRYIVLWVVGSLIVEYPFYKMHRIILNNGYDYWMEPFFYTLMYSMIRLHYSRPFLTYGLSIVVIVFMLHYFNVSIK
ncbi:CBO0543 family protein [Bacillaceae bacterium C204]|uniref:CBO0543 family protein n=1 Tax=Neobacillus sp. 204 TaxID=3383351 RepID=UPI00397A54F5